jgi:hypothetical protein
MLVHMAIIPALGRLRQEDHEFKASLGCLVRPCLKKSNQKKKELASQLLGPVHRLRTT